MIEWLGIGHLFELSRTEAIAGFFTPLVIFAVFFLAQLILPGKWVPGYVINPKTSEPRTYRLNGILVFAIALIVWAFELTGLTCGPHGRVAGVDRRGVVCRTLMFWPGNRLPKFGRSEAAKTAISRQLEPKTQSVDISAVKRRDQNGRSETG